MNKTNAMIDGGYFGTKPAAIPTYTCPKCHAANKLFCTQIPELEKTRKLYLFLSFFFLAVAITSLFMIYFFQDYTILLLFISTLGFLEFPFLFFLFVKTKSSLLICKECGNVESLG